MPFWNDPQRDPEPPDDPGEVRFDPIDDDDPRWLRSGLAYGLDSEVDALDSDGYPF